MTSDSALMQAVEVGEALHKAANLEPPAPVTQALDDGDVTLDPNMAEEGIAVKITKLY